MTEYIHEEIAPDAHGWDTDLSEARPGDVVRLTLVRRVGGLRYAPTVPLFGTDVLLSEVGLRIRHGADTVDTDETATKVEKVTKAPEPYTAQRGDVVRLYFSDGAGLYSFDGDRFVRIGSGENPGGPQARSIGERMVRSGVEHVDALVGGDSYTYGGELLVRDGAPV